MLKFLQGRHTLGSNKHSTVYNAQES